MTKYFCDRCGTEMKASDLYGSYHDIQGIYKDDFVIDGLVKKIRETTDDSDKKECCDEEYPFVSANLCANCTLAFIPTLNRFMNEKKES